MYIFIESSELIYYFLSLTFVFSVPVPPGSVILIHAHYSRRKTPDIWFDFINTHWWMWWKAVIVNTLLCSTAARAFWSIEGKTELNTNYNLYMWEILAFALVSRIDLIPRRTCQLMLMWLNLDRSLSLSDHKFSKKIHIDLLLLFCMWFRTSRNHNSPLTWVLAVLCTSRVPNPWSADQCWCICHLASGRSGTRYKKMYFSFYCQSFPFTFFI